MAQQAQKDFIVALQSTMGNNDQNPQAYIEWKNFNFRTFANLTMPQQPHNELLVELKSTSNINGQKSQSYVEWRLQ